MKKITLNLIEGICIFVDWSNFSLARGIPMGLGITGFLSFFPGVDSVLRGASPGSKLLAPGPSLEPTAGS